MIPQHQGGRMHVGVLFQEASDKCTDDCGTGTVCFEHMTERLKEVADKMQALELQVGEQTQDIEFYRALILRVYCTHKPEVQDTNCNRCQMTWRDNLRAQGNLYLRPALKPKCLSCKDTGYIETQATGDRNKCGFCDIAEKRKERCPKCWRIIESKGEQTILRVCGGSHEGCPCDCHKRNYDKPAPTPMPTHGKPMTEEELKRLKRKDELPGMERTMAEKAHQSEQAAHKPKECNHPPMEMCPNCDIL